MPSATAVLLSFRADGKDTKGAVLINLRPTPGSSLGYAASPVFDRGQLGNRYNGAAQPSASAAPPGFINAPRKAVQPAQDRGEQPSQRRHLSELEAIESARSIDCWQSNALKSNTYSFRACISASQEELQTWGLSPTG
jgi:hypothetical protein